MLCPLSPSWGINCLFLRILLPQHHWPSAHKNKQENDFCASVEPSQQWHLWCVLLDLFGPWCHIPLWCTGLIRRNGYLSVKIIILIYPMHCGASVGGGGGSKLFFFFLLEKVLSLTCVRLMLSIQNTANPNYWLWSIRLTALEVHSSCFVLHSL